MSRPTPISTRLHGVLDYVTGATLIAAPSLLGLGGTRAGAAMRVAGVGHALYSLVTDYELGVAKLVPMRAHLAADAVGAVGLAVAPWLLGEADEGADHWLPHLVLGVYELGAVALSDPGD